MRTTIRALLLLLTLGLALPAQAGEPVLDEENQCANPGGQGDTCATEADCAPNPYATICVEHTIGDPFSRRCEIPCEGEDGGTLDIDRSACAMGETCVEGRATPGRRGYYCRPSAFRVDLNLLDQAVVYHIEGRQPAFSAGDCSLQANLEKLLDQNGDNVFDIFDLDLAVLAFLEQPGCDPEDESCEADDLVFCLTDDDCGEGLYCSETRYTCQRDCGVIASREDSFASLERECTGALKLCDHSRGKCETVDVSQTRCQVDSECPAGAYCLVGRCAPNCYRSSDCPCTDWYCTENNRCRPLAPPDAEEGFVFDPQDYAVRFSRSELNLDPIQVFESSELLIMDLLTKKNVVDNPAVNFGYRLEVTYGLKEEARCLQAFVDCTDELARPEGETEAACRARQDDCYVDDTEQWIQLLSPFGTVSARGDAAVEVILDEFAADKLTPGVYGATIKAIFDNGDSDELRVVFSKTSPSGEYAGSLTVTYGDDTALLNGNRPIQFGMRLFVTDETTRWNELMETHNVVSNDDLVDTTEGYVVYGRLHGDTAFAYSNPAARSSDEDEVRFVGLYAPAQESIRLLGFIDVEPDHCLAATGEPCDPDSVQTLAARNLFGRKIRRRIEFVGPFDEAQALYHGLYREKISGLASDYDITLEGGFRMSQVLADSTPLTMEEPLLAAGTAAPGFPDDDDVLEAVEADIAAYCAGGDATDPSSAAWAADRFDSQSAYLTYVRDARRAGDPTEWSALGRTTVFPRLRQFSDLIDNALGALGTDPAGQQQHLNIYEFVSERLLPCDPSDASPSPVCIDEDAVRCGLALHQKALIEGWVALDELLAAHNLPGEGGQDMFCVDTIPTAGCPNTAADSHALFTIQEHNRFWLDLAQILKFDADEARSNAFLVLYRNEVNPFAQGAALSYKSDQLRYAVARYDELMKVLLGDAAGKVLFRIPAEAFKQLGDDYIDQMIAITEDRMGALAELADLERRVFSTSGDATFVYAQQAMQQEYLTQVYIMALQAHWQGSEFEYLGNAGEIFETGQTVLGQLNPSRNAIGNQPDVVFFENDDPTRDNWEHYREVLVGLDGEGGLVGDAQEAVLEGVAQLQGALSDLDALEASLQEAHYALQDSLLEICGDPDPGDPTGQVDDYCQYLRKQYATYEDWTAVRDCALQGEGDDCGGLATVECADYESAFPEGENNCEEVIATFVDSTDATQAEGALAPVCKLDTDEVTISVNGVPRPCVGGQMGQLLQEQASLDLQRVILVREVQGLVGKMNDLVAWMELTEELEVAFHELSFTMEAVDAALTFAMSTGDLVGKIFDKASGAVDCVVIAGLAVGTDCPQGAAVGVAQAIKESIWGIIKLVMESAQQAMKLAMSKAAADYALAMGDYDDALTMRNLERQVSAKVSEFALLSQEAVNLGAQLEDLRYQAQYAADRFEDQVSFAADHLVGRETGYMLRGDALVREASGAFHDIVDYAHRMAMAFVHHYNLPSAEATALVNKAMAIVTLDDAREFVASLDVYALEYCGREAVDCDWSDPSNVKVLRFSLREQLFPTLRDIVDARTGKVVTAGEQFSNLITQPPYLKRRVRGVLTSDQIELPFGVPVTLQEGFGDDLRWLINPLECNQHLAAGDWEAVGPESEGTVAVQVVGENFGGPGDQVWYELVRGGTDYIRSCHAESTVEEIGTLPVLDYPVRSHMVSYAPQSDQATEETVPSFVVRSSAFAACMAEEEASEVDDLPCWKTFARGRSLAASDWKIVVPLFVGGGATDNAWVIGDGLPAEERPVIEDIVLYFRYYARPIEEL